MHKYNYFSLFYQKTFILLLKVHVFQEWGKKVMACLNISLLIGKKSSNPFWYCISNIIGKLNKYSFKMVCVIPYSWNIYQVILTMLSSKLSFVNGAWTLTFFWSPLIISTFHICSSSCHWLLVSLARLHKPASSTQIY